MRHHHVHELLHSNDTRRDDTFCAAGTSLVATQRIIRGLLLSVRAGTEAEESGVPIMIAE